MKVWVTRAGYSGVCVVRVSQAKPKKDGKSWECLERDILFVKHPMRFKSMFGFTPVKGTCEEYDMPMNKIVVKVGKCKVCGCTDHDCSQCIKAEGWPCDWVDETHDLCTRCERELNDTQAIQTDKEEF